MTKNRQEMTPKPSYTTQNGDFLHFFGAVLSLSEGLGGRRSRFLRSGTLFWGPGNCLGVVLRPEDLLRPDSYLGPPDGFNYFLLGFFFLTNFPMERLVLFRETLVSLG